MKRLVALALMAVMVPAAGAKVWTTVYRCDEVTPLDAVDPNYPTVYRDIMVGTRLVIVVSSDTPGYWVGQLRLSWDDVLYAALSGRGYTTTRPGSTAFYPNYRGSCLPAAGAQARVRDYRGPSGIGFEVASDPKAVPGDWFVVDYYARQVGICNVKLYDAPVKLDAPLQTLSFLHVPSRDFNSDAMVDFQDFALLASHWSTTVAPDPNRPASALDLDSDGRIDLRDLALFSEYWLQRTDCTTPTADPNDPLAGTP